MPPGFLLINTIPTIDSPVMLVSGSASTGKEQQGDRQGVVVEPMILRVKIEGVRTPSPGPLSLLGTQQKPC